MEAGAFDISKFAALEDRADRDIDDQYDLPDVMRGVAPKGQENSSGRMVLALQDFGSMMSKPFLRRLESALIRLAKVNLSLMLQHWPRYMWERLIEPDEKSTLTPEGSKEAKFKEKDADDVALQDAIAAKWEEALEKIRPEDLNQPPGISVADIDVRITAGSSMPTNRIAKSQLAIEFTQAGIYDAEAALEYIDDPKKDEVVRRIKAKEEKAMQAEFMK